MRLCAGKAACEAVLQTQEDIDAISGKLAPEREQELQLQQQELSNKMQIHCQRCGPSLKTSINMFACDT